MRQTTEDQLE